MAKLTWHDAGTRVYETGVSDGVLYPKGANGVYEKGVAWNGLTQVSEKPEGAEPQDFFADNIKYATMRSAETFSATIEAYTYPDEWAECDGSSTITKGVIFGQQGRKAFGLSYKTVVGSDTLTDNKAYKIHLIYNCTASPSERSYETINDSPNAITFSWEMKSIPEEVGVDGVNLNAVSSITIDTTKLDQAGKTALSELEKKLYGDTSTEPTLPSPKEVYEMFKTA